MEDPWFRYGEVAASATIPSPNIIPLIRARTLSITTNIYFGASIDANATVYVYYSPDGENWDTIAYTSWAITYSADATVQRTVTIDMPEHGYFKIAIANGSSADTLDRLAVWYSIQAWGFAGGQSKGDISTESQAD